MNKLFLAIALLAAFAHGAYVHGGLVYDKATGVWRAAGANPEATVSQAAEKRLSERKKAIQEARAKALATTNTIYKVILPGEYTIKGKRVFSKMKLVLALQDSGQWESVKQWIVAAGLYDVYLAAQDVCEDNPHFIQGLSIAKEQFGVTEDEIEAVLKNCLVE